MHRGCTPGSILSLADRAACHPFTAGVEGILQRVDGRTNNVFVIVDDFVLVYTNLINPRTLNPGDPVTPDTIIGDVDPANQHVHVEVRYPASGPRLDTQPAVVYARYHAQRINMP